MGSLHALDVNGGRDLFGEIPAVVVIDDIFHGHDHGFRVRGSAVIVVVDRDEAHGHGGEDILDIHASFHIVPPEPGKIFDDNTADLSGTDVFQHMLEFRAVKIRTGEAIVFIDFGQFQFRVLDDKIPQQGDLRFHGIPVFNPEILKRKPCIDSGLYQGGLRGSGCFWKICAVPYVYLASAFTGPSAAASVCTVWRDSRDVK